MAEQSDEFDDLAMVREAHAAQPYEFKTDLTYCPSSDVPTDQCHTCIVLARLDHAEEMHAEAFRIGIAKQDQVGRVEALLDQVDRVAHLNRHLARLSTREVREALRTPPGVESDG